MVEIDTSVASIARVYDAMLGGKDNYEVDREIRDRIVECAPEAMAAARDGRSFLLRVTRYLAGVVGIDQFLDCGSGLPTAENTHEIAQRVNPDAVVVYVDNDPLVLAHGRALLDADERSHFVAADLTRPAEVLADPVVRAKIDFSRPLALYQIGTLHHVSDEQDPAAIMRRYLDALPAGSYVALAHLFNPRDGSELAEVAARVEQVCTSSSLGSGWFRTGEQILRFVDGLEVLEPGLVPVADWWPTGPRATPLGLSQRAYVGVVGRKP
ncbi:SAM-dependent methyltransferase [Saccharopolyspora rosea]|uniref:SAM-dependent methyltransferase n=1 Tax=Saccharopolyspora rosea TaxID=524884 RepID=A0ABW3FR15_9PSEU|nr:SAM-dependent methyltransferase [Saccharopolyspora rosea]